MRGTSGWVIWDYIIVVFGSEGERVEVEVEMEMTSRVSLSYREQGSRISPQSFPGFITSHIFPD